MYRRHKKIAYYTKDGILTISTYMYIYGQNTLTKYTFVNYIPLSHHTSMLLFSYLAVCISLFVTFTIFFFFISLFYLYICVCVNVQGMTDYNPLQELEAINFSLYFDG